jgi:hypothetical protein
MMTLQLTPDELAPTYLEISGLIAWHRSALLILARNQQMRRQQEQAGFHMRRLGELHRERECLLRLAQEWMIPLPLPLLPAPPPPPAPESPPEAG